MASKEESERPRCRLYLISPPQIDLDVFTDQLLDAFEGGDVGAFQLRLKEATDGEILAAAERLKPLCQAKQAAFILNDRPDLAKACEADGLHLGQDDGSVEQARAIVGTDCIIGVSCHDSRHLAMEAAEQGADYVAFGAFYPTFSKSPEYMKRYGVPNPDILHWWQEYMLLPVVAIGGITPANCGPLVAAGADFVAVITGVWQYPEGPKQAVTAFNNAIDAAMLPSVRIRQPTHE